MLFEPIAAPVAEAQTRGAWLVGRRLVALDGTLLDCPDTLENDAEIGRASGEDHPSPFPQARVVALVECGTHAAIGAAIGTTIGTTAQGERELAESLLGLVEPGMLLVTDMGIYDMGIYSYPLWKAAVATGADLLWRVPANLRLPVTQALPDGSYLSYVDDPDAKKRARDHARGKGRAPADMGRIIVRVIEYQITNRDTRDETIRLITTITAFDDITAVELAAAYHERWERMVAVKTHYDPENFFRLNQNIPPGNSR